MTTKSKTQIMSHDDTVMSPITKASNVLFEDGETAQDKLEDNVEKSFTPSVENSSSMFKVGQGDNVDYSGNVVDGAYVSCVLKGKTMVNCIQESSSQDVILPYEFTEGQYVTINETKESGALGVELKGQTLVNLVDKIQHAWGGTALTLTRDSGYTELSVTETALWYQTSVKHTGLIKLSTTYLAILEVVENTLATPFTLTGNANDGKFLMVNNIVRAGQTGIFKIKLNSKPTFDTSGANRFDLFMQFGKNESVGNKIKLRLMLIEYQQDMENWDIPYFEGMTSVKTPTVKTVGKNLFGKGLNCWTGERVNVIKLKEGEYSIQTEPSNKWEAQNVYIPIKLKQNEKIYTYGSIKNITNVRIFKNDLDTTVAQFNPSPIPTEYESFELSYVAPEDCTVLVRFWLNGTNSIGYIRNFMIEVGGKTTYEQHKSSSLTLPEEVILRSLPNGVCDTYNTRTGEYVQRIGETTIEELSRFTSFSSYAWGSIQSHGAFQLYNIAKHIDVECSDQWMQTQNMWSDNYVWANAWHGGSMSNPNPNDNLPNVFLAFSNDGHLRLMVRKTLIKPDSPQDVTANDIMDWGRQNVILSTRIQYQLKTPIITKVDPKSVLKPHNTKTHIYTEIPQNSLYPILSHSNPTYPVILKPSTKYSIVANPYSNNHTNSPINFNLGGATASATVGNRVTTVTTPSTLSNDLLTMSGRGNKLNHVMVIEGEVVGDEPYFEGICDVKSPVLSNLYNVYALSSAINQDWYSGDFNVTISPNQMSYHSCPPINIASLRQKKVYTGLARDGVVLREKNSFVVYFNSLGKRIGSRFGGSENGFTIPQEVTYIRLMHGIGGQSLNYIGRDEYFISTEKFEVGDKIIYKSNMTTFNQKDGKIIILRSLPNGVCDTLNVETGEYVKRIGEIVLDGTHILNYSNDWSNANYYGYYMTLSANNFATGTSAPYGLCDKLTFQRNVNFPWTTEGEYVVMGQTGLFIKLSKDKLNSNNSVDSLNSYLQSNPITVQYELETPIVSIIDVQGFPHAYTNGHVQLSSSHTSQSLTPKVEYSLPINRNGQIRMNQAMVERHQKHIDKLQAMIITNMVNTQYRQSLTKINYQLGGE